MTNLSRRPEGRWASVPYRTQIRRFVRKPLRMSKGALTMPSFAAYATGLRSTDDLLLPGFMGIGGVRSGSTWLHHNLGAHPDLYLPQTKELHFFNRRIHLGLGSYSQQFVDANGRIPGEITPSYGVIEPWRIRAVHSIVPDLRVILIVRNPIDRAWSHALMKLAREQGRDPGALSNAELTAHFRSDYSLQRGRFSVMIDNWTAVFGEPQVHIAFFEDIVERPRQMLSDVFQHIGVTDDIDWSTVPFNQVIDRGIRGGDDVIGSSSPPLPDQHREQLAALYAEEIATLADRLDGPTKRWQDAP